MMCLKRYQRSDKAVNMKGQDTLKERIIDGAKGWVTCAQWITKAEDWTEDGELR